MDIEIFRGSDLDGKVGVKINLLCRKEAPLRCYIIELYETYI